jgi:hypothetical protein
MLRQLADEPLWQILSTFGLPFSLYMLTLAPTIYNLDSAELTTAVATGGILRATGYPLYLIIGKIWSFLPLGDVGYRMNLFSAFWGAVTILLADRILRRLNVSSWARFGALGLLATAPYFWSLSLIAEVYTLQTALTAMVILSFMHWGDKPTPARMALSVLVLSLSMGNHAATVLLLPGVIWYTLSRHPRQLLQPKLIAAAILAVLAGLSVFLYIPLRFGAQPIFNYAGIYDATGTFHPVNLRSLDGFLWLVTGRTFAGQMFGYQLPELKVELLRFGEQLWVAFFAIGVVPGILGLVDMLKRDKSLGVMLTLMFAVNASFFINYRVIDKETMFLPTYLVWALFLGFGFQTLLKWIERGNRHVLLNWLVRGIMVGAVFLAVGWNWVRVDRSDDWSTREQAELILDEVEPDSLIFGWWETVPAIQYLQLIEGRRVDVTAINRFLISGDDMHKLILNEIHQRPVYINNPPINLLQQTKATRVGPLYHLELRE